VIAVLDSGVRQHPYFPDAPDDDPFLSVPPWRMDLGETGPIPLGSPGWAHATFIAGIIRQEAPAARVLSMRVMRDDGGVRETVIASALRWILDHLDEQPVDVISMSYGRQIDEHADIRPIIAIYDVLRELSRRGVRLVASAGNYANQELTYPAAFVEVDSVGAGTAESPAQFSTSGDWVTYWYPATKLVGLMPDMDAPLAGPGAEPAKLSGSGWTQWSGTSFAAARHAARLAKKVV
jgi:hypothetical protein